MTGREEKRHRQLLDKFNLKKREYWKLKEEALDRAVRELAAEGAKDLS
jgi:hypothetical protein